MLKLLQSIFALPSPTEPTESLEQLRRKVEELTAENLKLKRENTQLLDTVGELKRSFESSKTRSASLRSGDLFKPITQSR